MTATEQEFGRVPAAEQPPDPYPRWLRNRLDSDAFAVPQAPYDYYSLVRQLFLEARINGYPDRWVRWVAEHEHDPTRGFRKNWPDDWSEELAHIYAELDLYHSHPERTCFEWGCEHAPRAAKRNEGATYLRRWSVAELAKEAHSFEWLAEQFLPAPSFLGLGGEEKTLKSYIGAFLDICVAAGIPLFGQFKVRQSCPVVRHVGEGGMSPDYRRLVRIARSLGLTQDEFEALPLFSYYDIAPESSAPFIDTLHRDLNELAPGLVHIDPQYTYADRSVQSSDLVGRGGSLADLYAPVAERNACLAINDHFNQTGQGFNLKRFTGAGMTEHVDSWCLVKHGKPPTGPDVANGHFELVLKVGSRQWGELSWNLTLDIGPFDLTINDHIGDITWQIACASSVRETLASVILRLVKEHHGKLTKSSLATAAGGNYQEALETIDMLTTTKKLHTEPLAAMEGARNVTRDRYVLTTPANSDS